MLLQLRALWNGEADSLPVDAVLNLSKDAAGGDTPFREPVTVKGTVENRAGIVTLRATIAYVIDGCCDRCLRDIHRAGTLKMEHILVLSSEHEDNDELIVIPDATLKLDELAEEDLLLSLPSKLLCREDCRGLCQYCGKDLNEGLCGCKHDAVDPRLAALKQLISDE